VKRVVGRRKGGKERSGANAAEHRSDEGVLALTRKLHETNNPKKISIKQTKKEGGKKIKRERDLGGRRPE